MPTKLKVSAHRHILFLIFQLIFLGFFSAPAAAVNIDKIVVFGDSLSDNGNMFELTTYKIPRKPPYFWGHFSDGPIWIEYLAKRLHIKTYLKSEFADHAYAKAWGSDFTDPDPLAFFTFSIEITEYFNQQPKNADQSKHLFTIWLGSNDYLAGDKTLSVDEATDQTVNAIIDGMQTLIQKGGRYFLVLNLTDLGLTPSSIEEGPEKAQRVSALAFMHNKKLADKLNELRAAHPEILIMEGDLMSYFKDMMTHPQKREFNLKVLDKPCYDGDFGSMSDEENKSVKPKRTNIRLNKAYYNLKSTPLSEWHVCDNPDDHIYWDSLHPTTHVHKILADLMMKILVKNDIHGPH